MNLLKESDFTIFRTSFESGRQTPQALSKAIIINIVMQLVLGVAIFAAADPVVRPEYNKLTLLIIQYTMTLLLIIYAAIYIFPNNYFKKQHTQLLVANLLLLNFLSIFPFYGALFVLVRTVDVSEGSFFGLAIVVIVSGIVFYLSILHRLRRSIEVGNYRKESEKINYEKVLKRDRAISTRLPEFIIAGIGVVFIISYLMSTMSEHVEMMILCFMLFLLFYMGIFLFAYSTIGVYCKKRFKSFNFDEEGELHPYGSGDRVVDKKTT